VTKFGKKVPRLRCDSHTSFKVKRSKVRVTRPINADTHRAPYLPNAKVYELTAYRWRPEANTKPSLCSPQLQPQRMIAFEFQQKSSPELEGWPYNVLDSLTMHCSVLTHYQTVTQAFRRWLGPRFGIRRTRKTWNFFKKLTTLCTYSVLQTTLNIQDYTKHKRKFFYR